LKLKQSIIILAACIAAIFLIHIVHALTLDRIIQYVEISFQSPRIPEEMDGFRIAFVTDTHNISPERLQGVAERLNASDIHLLLLGGDMYHQTYENPWVSIGILSQVETTYGIFGVDGNHDYRILLDVMESYGITPLSNSGVHIRENFFLAGVDDTGPRRLEPHGTEWAMFQADIPTAVADAHPNDFVLLLTHMPDEAMRQPTVGIDLILAGHTHGGQITFFGIWAPALARGGVITNYGQRFRSGWAESRDGVPVFVSNGTGAYLPRVFARPQVVIVTLRH